MANTFGYERASGLDHGFELADEQSPSHGFERADSQPQIGLLSKEGVSSIGKTLGPSLKQGLLGVKLRQQENPQDQLVGKPIVKIPGREMDAHVAKPEEIEQTRKDIASLQEEVKSATPENESYPLKIARGVSQSIAQNLGPLAASVAIRSPIPALTGAGIITGGQTYADNRVRKSPVDIDTAKLNANIHTGVESALELAPVGGLLKDLKKDTFGKLAGKFVLREEATEIPTTILQNTSDQVLITPDKPLEQFAKETVSDVIDTAVMTPFAAGGTVAIASAQSRMQDEVSRRLETRKLQKLGEYKEEAANDLIKRLQDAELGIDENVAIDQDINSPTIFDDIPDRPLSEAEEQLAVKIEQNTTVGADTVAESPDAIADIADLDLMLTDPVYQQPEETARKVEDQIQFDMDRGMSREVAERRAREAFPNQQQPTKRTISWSTDPTQVGLTPRQTKLAPGSVALLGGNEDQFSPAYINALGSTIQAWAQKWMPTDSRIILNLSGLTGEAVGGYQLSASGIHVITPRELVRSERAETETKKGVSLGRLPGTGYNAFTQQQTFGAIAHEFGHAVTMASFAAAMPRAHKNVISALDTGRIYSEQELATMPAAEAAVVRDYQAMKAAVLSGQMTAEELVEKWLGTWKLGKDLMKRQERSLYAFAKEVLLREAKLTGDSRLSSTSLNQIPARTLVHAMGRNANLPVEESNAAAEAYYLQFNEYMAEQFSRYAHAKRIDEGTALGVYFKKALQQLREFFKMLKTSGGKQGQAIVAPGTSFQEWVDGLAEARAKKLAEKAKRKPRAPRKKMETPKPRKKAEQKVKEVVEETQAEEESAGEGQAVSILETMAEDPIAKELVRERIRTTLPDPKDRTRAELMQLVARGQLLEAVDQLEDIAKSQSKLDIDSSESRDIAAALERAGELNVKPWTRAMNFVKERTQSLLQMQQIAHTSDDAGARSFVSYQNMLMAMKNNMLKKGTDVAKQWEDLSRRDSELVEKVLRDEWESGGHVTLLEQDPVTKKWEHRAGASFAEYLKKRGIDGTTEEGADLAKLILDIKNSILEHIQVIENTALEIAKDKYKTNSLLLQQKAHEVRELARQWRQTPFLPQSHYGNFVVTVRGTDEDGKRQVVYKAHYETAAEQDAAVARLRKIAGADNVSWNKLDENVGPQLILPKDFIQTLSDTGEFSSDQLEAIGDAMTPLRTGAAFKKLERDASRIAGASQDMLRNYANWIEDSANFTSKLRFGRKLSKARAWTRSDMNELKAAGDIEGAREKQRLLDTMAKTQQFILHPMEEWFQARSAIALTYLMYAPKTALMNATGLFQSWAAMTADYGELRGNALMAGSIKDLVSGKLTEDEHWMKNKALEDGIIDQGFGYFMSGLANAGNLARRVRPTLAGKAARGFVDLGMYPFKAVETANRNVTMMAVYRAERQRLLARGETTEIARSLAYEAAARKTRLLQNDYASGNRPEILRGKKSLFMIFLSYPQYMLWIMSGGYERGTRQDARNRGETPRSVFGGTTMRMWLIFLALSGLEGVPFGEAIGDLLQQMWKLFGKGDNIRLETQRFLKETAGIESMYWRNVMQRGFLHDVLGVDLSGSYSLGKPLPGLGLIDPHANNWREFVGEAFEELSGPFGGVVKGALGLSMSEDVGAKEIGQSLPGTAGAIARMLAASESGLKSSKGERILRDEAGNLREPTAKELALLGSGFRLSEVARFQELEALKRQQAEYWNGRRLGLKKSYQKALEDRDPALREDVDKAVAEYNAEIPHRALRLTGKELRAYTRNTTRRVRRLERDRDPQRVRGLNRDISQVLSDS